MGYVPGMSVSDDFLQYVLDQLADWGRVASRRMFGGAGLYRDGKMFGLIAEDTVYLKVGDANRGDYEVQGCKPFKPYADRATVMSYYEVPPDVLEDPVTFKAWARKALAVQKGT